MELRAKSGMGDRTDQKDTIRAGGRRSAGPLCGAHPEKAVQRVRNSLSSLKSYFVARRFRVSKTSARSAQQIAGKRIGYLAACGVGHWLDTNNANGYTHVAHQQLRRDLLSFSF